MTTDKSSQTGKSKKFEKEVFEALRESGFHLRVSDEEVQEFVERVGETKIELPESLSNPDKLFDVLSEKVWSGKEKEAYAFAARGQRTSELPSEVIEKMKDDIIHGKKVKGKLGKNGGKKKN